MADLVDRDSILANAKPNAVVAGPDPIPAGEIPGKSLRATHVGPIRQSLGDFLHTFLDRPWQGTDILPMESTTINCNSIAEGRDDE